mgnify:FL=1
MKKQDKKEYLMIIDQIENEVINGVIDNKQYDEEMTNLKYSFNEKN